jgi:ADP-L-glycero-D-manno-heptose 6-epimerase
MNILVTGHLGFIGSNLKKALEERRHDVFGIDESIFVELDWRDKLDELLTNIRPSCVFHVGACSDTLNDDISYVMTRNFDFTYGLSLWCQAYNIPLIYSSSAAIYGNDSSMNLYAWSKYCGESLVTMANGISLRYFNVYGPGEENKGKMASMFYQAWQNQNNGVVTKLFRMNPMRDFVYIDDVVEANLYALDFYPFFKGKVFDVGTGNARTFENALEHMKIPYEYYDSNVELPKYYQFYTKASEHKFMTNWMAKNSLEVGLEKYIQYLKNKKNNA